MPTRRDGSVRFLYISAGIERLNGVRVEDVLRDAGTLHRQSPPEYIERLVDAEARSDRELSDFDMDLPMRRPDGEVRWMRLHSRPRRLPDGRTIWDGVQIDITDRKRAEEALRENEARLRLAQESASVGIWDWTVETGAMELTPELNKLYGLPSGTIKTYQDWRDRVHPDDIGRIEAGARCGDGEARTV